MAIVLDGTANTVTPLNGALGGTTPSTVAATTVVASSTIKGATTIAVGNATPSASGAGITFPATQSASTDANTLDDYEEGTISGMTVTGGTSGSMNLNSIAGKYVKVGDMVAVNIYLRQATTTATGTYMLINNALPFTPAGNPFYVYSANFNFYFGASYPCIGIGTVSGLYIQINPTTITNGQEMSASIVYKINN